jgi:hypothetical protein
MDRPMKPLFIILLFTFFLVVGCSPVKPYQRMYVNDREMNMQQGARKFEEQAQVYREGAAGGGSKKGSGGCGCN